jgi:hypothetical protein
MTWAQTATIPTNSTSEAKAAASSTNVFNMTDSLEQNRNNVLFLFYRVKIEMNLGTFRANKPYSDRNGRRFTRSEIPTGRLDEPAQHPLLSD